MLAPHGNTDPADENGVRQFMRRVGRILALPKVATLYLNGNGEFTGTVLAEQTPASAAAAGTKGSVVYDGGYVYVCVATNTWKRAALSTW